MPSSAPQRTTKSPAFLFDVQDYRSSRSVQRMTWAQRGMYLEMLCEQWDKGSLPDDPRAVAALLGGTDEEWISAWPELRRKFVDRRNHTRDDSAHQTYDASRRIINLRLERTRRERKAYIKTMRERAAKGGHGKAQKLKELESSTSSDKQSTSVLNLPIGKERKGEERTGSGLEGSGQEIAPAAEARSKRPMFKGQRFVVFEWMLDDLRKLLGAHFEDFDVHEWFFELDARAEKAGVVVPQRDGGKWLQEQTHTEAIRRGLPVAAARAQSGKTAGNAPAIARFIARGNQ